MRIAVCDDDKIVMEDIVRMIEKCTNQASIKTFATGGELMKAKEEFDVLFLDIAMGDISGIEVAKNLRNQQERAGKKRGIIIFVTSYREYMEEAFDVNAYHYLVKPLDEQKFQTVLKRALKDVSTEQMQNEKYILVKAMGVQKKLLLRDIYYIESSNKKVVFHLKDEKIETYGKMEELERELQKSFYRCHRCYLVNMEKISAYSVDTIELTNKEKLILAQKKYSDFIKCFMKYAKDGGIVNV